MEKERGKRRAASEKRPPVGCKRKNPESVLMKRADSPVPSCVSLKSDWSMEPPIAFREGPFPTDQSVLMERADSPVPSCVSMKSDRSMHQPLAFREGPFPTDQRDQMEECSSNRHDKLSLSSILKSLEEKTMKFLKDELKTFVRHLDQNYPECSEPQLEEDNDLDCDGQMQKTSVREVALKITLYILRTMKQNDLADMLDKRQLMLQEFKVKLKKQFECVFEGKAKEGQPTLLSEIYTELYITEGGTGAVNDEHEVRQIETASKKRRTEDTTVKCNDIFKPLCGREAPIRTVLTKGVAGIGKTVSVQKFILDWAEGKANQDVHFIFALPFRDLNFIKGEYSLIELLHHFVPELKSFESTELFRYKVLFIFDGLDECRLTLDFQNNESWFDVTKKTSLDVLLTNLIKGNLLPSALLWITSRPAAANQIPPECVHQVTEIRGFSDAQKEEYFRKRFNDQSLASRIITHVKSSRSLFIMCHIPVFCWISATVLKRLFSENDRGEIPKTLTEMYTHFLIFQTSLKNDKYMKNHETELKEYSKEFLLKLGKLAFDNLEKGNLIFYEQDLTENGIDVAETSVYSGVCTEVFKEEYGLYQEKVYCFVHLSIQEYLAALYVFLSNSSADLLKTAVDQALKSKNGHLDLYLRFLLGLSTDSSKTLLQRLLGPTRISSHTIKETTQYIRPSIFQTTYPSELWEVLSLSQKPWARDREQPRMGGQPITAAQYIKEKIQENLSPERTINLFHCLTELGDNSLVEEVQRYLNSGNISADDLSPAQYSALAFVMLMSDEELDVFDLKKYTRSDKQHCRLLPVVKNSRTALLNSCDLIDKHCEVLTSTLRSNSSPLRELDLSDNNLKDLGVKLLSAALGDLHCKLQILRLSGCRVTEEGCSSLASALKSNPSHLRELDLSYNHPGDSGVKLLSAVLEDPSCKLEKLNVDHGGECRTRPGLQKYSCQLTLDPNTANRFLSLSGGNRKVTGGAEQPYPDHPERFDRWSQVLCRESLTGRCYWEAEWDGDGAWIGVTYKGIRRKGESDCGLGANNKSWSLYCDTDSYSVRHNKKHTVIPIKPSGSHRVGVYLDWGAGALSFYRVSSDGLTPLHRFTSSFTESLYPGFGVYPNPPCRCACWDSSLCAGGIIFTVSESHMSLLLRGKKQGQGSWSELMGRWMEPDTGQSWKKTSWSLQKT
ncbi:NACHT, LRR and PYD domains-containing protein 3-like [Brienomyrus brachyistius]|uniref:NACHT, LRR and PYD domains-containing protein 3-like n=1 Tax=Brienomyrus brachyistius TaxID=42636 RepID=UPI0020B2F045|nr:NACHT, LRR and PYD domains-containing protein 3-like [Brienomyrus brachyistius]